MPTDFALIQAELLLTIGALALMIIAAFRGDRVAIAINWAAIALLAAAAAILLWAAPTGLAFSGTFSADGFANATKVIVYCAAIAALVAAPRFFGEYRAEYPLLVLFACLGMGIMVSAQDLMTLYIGLELNSLSAYVLASFMRNDPRSTEAGLKYFVLGALASGMLLYGSSLIYGFAGTTAYAGIATAFQADVGLGLLFGMIFLIAGLAFKISAVPFHMWTPDVYEGAPTPVTAFFASAPKVAGVALLMRVCLEAMPGAAQAWQQIITFMAIASMVLGAVGAIGQTNIKRLLAYSSIANVGFILVGLASANPAGFLGVLIYLIVYVIMTLGSFLVILQLRDRDGRSIEDISALGGLYRARPGLATAMTIFMFSLAGIPPLFGFWPKLLVFNAAIAGELFPLAIIGVIASVIGAYYYLRIIKVMLFDPPTDVIAASSGGGLAERGLITLAAVYVSIGGWLLIGPLHRWASTAITVLLQ